MSFPKSQNGMILAHLKAGYNLTALQALEWFGCLRLAARIKNLRDEGHKIATTKTTTTTGKSVALYWMEERP